ncbi:hypothetical protein K9U39_01325 [Rhodoblastus acidophilus]|uniref:Tetratricopeptide repeat protein n=1 Tax=Candidatus Rhodoblastus alkanivorans TaxID=2954117 RepID=A0ABS9Z530_9HYPH|nr:hypothetical protein [Candidatus Rhodoblastus alkanivorans]MCI4680853.1 hypothetical protein [Candidatus Rhodoblastus alkanivorans]MCI4682292.1 hypothetical protein [Candidatus Rhodoblastus alkanivorans]MDI4639594.1 hypothetical protein [Rhodoblastus acidophilus]
MFSWFATRLFYAIVFFFLGAWTASVSPHFRGMLHHASDAGAKGFDKMRDWTSGTLMIPPDVSRPNSDQPAAAPPPASEAPPVQAAAAPQAESQHQAATAPQSPAADKPQAPAAAAPQAQATNAPQAPAAQASDAKEKTLDAKENGELLARARAAYARHDAAAAISAYRAYIDRNPATCEARGELGNIYFAEGRKRDAAQMYSECAIKRLEAGDIPGAIALISPVIMSDPVVADELMRRIDMAQQKKN